MTESELRSVSLRTSTEVRKFFRSLTQEFLAKTQPYVYAVFHKRTMDFYFGFRCANRVPPSYDLGCTYITSCATIKKNPDAFYFRILKVFKSAERAYEFEQRLIKAHFKNPKCLNRHWQTAGNFTMLGSHRPDVAEYNSLSKTKPRVKKTFKCEHCKISFTKVALASHLRAQPPRFCGKPCATAFTSAGRKPWNTGLSIGPSWNKGLSNPNGAANGRKGAAKLSKIATGRKREYRKDGSWFWTYPDAQFRAAA